MTPVKSVESDETEKKSKPMISPWRRYEEFEVGRASSRGNMKFKSESGEVEPQ